MKVAVVRHVGGEHAALLAPAVGLDDLDRLGIVRHDVARAASGSRNACRTCWSARETDSRSRSRSDRRRARASRRNNPRSRSCQAAFDMTAWCTVTSGPISASARSRKWGARLMVQPPPESAGSSIQSLPACAIALREARDEAVSHVLDAVGAPSRSSVEEIAIAEHQRHRREGARRCAARARCRRPRVRSGRRASPARTGFSPR